MAIPFTTITLDRVRHLRFGMASMVEFEQLTGIKVTSIGNDMDMQVMSKLLWVMLRQDEPELTLEQTCRLVDDNVDDLAAVMASVAAAIQAAFGTPKSPNAKTPAKKK